MFSNNILRFITVRLIVVVLTIVVCLLFAEVITRLFGNISPPLRIKDQEIGERYVRNYSGNVYVGESGNYVHLRFNKDGFRGDDRTYEKPLNTCRIVVLGDSEIAAIATKEESTLVRQLEKKLDERNPEVHWEVFNFGISAASTAQEIILYRKLASKYDPDLVICAYYVGNDFSDNCDRLSWYPRLYMNLTEDGDLYEEPVSIRRSFISTWLNQHSRFYVWQKNKVNVAIHTVSSHKGIYRIRGGPLIFMNKHDEDLDYAWRLNGRLIREFYTNVNKDDRLFLFVVIPSSVQLYYDAWEEFYAKDKSAQKYFDVDYPDKRLSEICNNEGINYLLLRDGFKKVTYNESYKNTDYQLLYGGTGHMNKKGNLLAAGLIYNYLDERGMLRQLEDRIVSIR